MSKVISVNAGSSSLKFQLYNMPSEEVLVAGVIERIGLNDSVVTIKFNNQKKTTVLDIKDHSQAVKILLDLLISEKILISLDEIDACGHRIVHGGEKFATSTILTSEVEKEIESLNDLAPLHNPANLTGYRAFKAALPHAGHVAVFDTAFHQTMAPVEYIYPIPYEYYKNFQVRRYGFHGTSHLFVSARAIELLGNPSSSKIITCHLGNGASLAAVKDGKCIATSMGFTPLAGVMMGTRSGDIDPAIIPFLAKKLNMDAEGIGNILNKKSGLLGVSGISSDARDIIDAVQQGNERAILARSLHISTVVSTIGSYFVKLGGCDAIVFTAGLGENDIDFRIDTIKALESALGVKLDLVVNNARGKELLVSTKDSKIKVFVIPTNEEIVIARDTQKLLKI